MRLIVCGSRDIGTDTHRHIDAAMESLIESVRMTTNRRVSEVFSGTCRGIDLLGETWARQMDVPVRRFPADWSLGPKAGPLRNQAMVDEADAVVAIMYPDSRGTKDCVRRAIAKGIPVAMLVLPRREGGG